MERANNQGGGMSENGKTATKTATGRNGNVIPLGAHPGNTGGKKGRSGRPTSAVREAAQQAVEKHKLLNVVAKIARTGERDGDRLTAVKLLLAYGFGQPEQRIEHTGEDGGPIEFVTEARESFAGRMDRLITRLGTPNVPSRIN